MPKTFPITLSFELALKLEATAKREGRDVSDVISQAFQDYYGEFVFRSLQEVREYAATRNPHGYTEEDIPRLIKEVRAEQAAEEAANRAAKAS